MSELAAAAGRVHTLAELGALLRQLRRRHARQQGAGQLTVREIARRTGYAYGVISDYLNGKALAPTDRFDVLVWLLGAGPDEQRALATARDRVEEQRRQRRPVAPAAALAPVPFPVPQELPPGVPDFTGRKRELAELDLLLDRSGAQPGVPPVAVVAGTAGVGKTALAVHWAHQVRAEFPDGCLYVDLRGYDPERPVPPPEALARFLRSLGVSGPDVPPTAAERAARYRTLLAERRALVLLDNAAGAEQVRPLLPGGSGCVTLVTSRDALPGLVTRHGASRIRLDPLDCDEAVDLLAALLGNRVTAEPDAAGTLAQRCARLPLALRLAAQLAHGRPEASLAELAAELRDRQQRLASLDAGADPGSAARATFSWSYQSLPAPAARAFRLLGLYPGPDLDGYALAALTGTDLARARRLLAELARGHLVQPTGAGRFGLHDLLRAYAAELVAGDPEPERLAALDRLRAQQWHACAVALDRIAPFDRDRRPAVPDPGWPVPPLVDQEAAVAWLDAERSSLVATALHAPEPEPGGHAGRLARVLVRYLDTGAHHHDAELLYTHAARAGTAADRANVLTSLGIVSWRLGRYRQAASQLEQARSLARECDDHTELGRALLGLGIIYWHLGRTADMLGCGQQALELSRRQGDRLGQARVLGNLGKGYRLLGDYPAAVDHHRQALALFQDAGDLAATANELCNLGVVHKLRGHLAEALRHLQEALRYARQTGYRECEAEVLSQLGTVHLHSGRLPAALRHQQRALDLVREIGDRTVEGYVLANLGAGYGRMGELGRALDLHRQALRIADQLNDHNLAAQVNNELGDTLRCGSRPQEAVPAYRQALAASHRTGDRYQRARAHDGLARALVATGDHRSAARHQRRARSLYAALGVPAADPLSASGTPGGGGRLRDDPE